MPSLSITIAVAELSTGNIVAGTSRFMGSFLAILQVGVGAWTGIQVSKRKGKKKKNRGQYEIGGRTGYVRGMSHKASQKSSISSKYK